MLGFRHVAAAANSEFVLNIAASVANPNIRALAIDAGWNQSARLILNITAPLVNTLLIGDDFDAVGGILINISANTRIGGVSGSASQGGIGGTALIVRQACTINNLGIISGGGGAGGQGGGAYAQYGQETGRAWAGGGQGGRGQGFNAGATTVVAAATGDAGSYAVLNVAVVGGQSAPWARGGDGGAGGNWGAVGSIGSLGSIGGSNNTGDRWYAPSAGARAGYAVEGNGLVTWQATGTRVGGLI